MTLFTTPEFKVGVLVVIVSALIGVMSLKVAEGPGLFHGAHDYWMLAPDAGGLIKNSAVKMAGIKVGTITDIILTDGQARINFRVEGNARVTGSSKAELKSDGILGDRHVEITPGMESEPILADGSQLPSSGQSSNLGDVMKEISRISHSLNDLVKTLNTAVSGVGDPGSPVGRIVLNIEKISSDLANVTGQNREKINEILARVHSIAKNVDTYVNDQTLARVDTAIKNIEEITDKVNRGEGTLGRLINDDQTVTELNSAITNVNKFLGGTDKMQTSLDFHSEHLSAINLTKTYVGLKIQPGLDRYYEIAVIDDPRGVVETRTDKATPPGTSTETITNYKSKVKFSALFAKNFYDFTIKGGLIENSGGVGIDYHLLDQKFRLSAEFFNFQDLYIRAFVRYNLFKGFYMVAGGDNLARSGDDKASAFFGAGLFITNDDLKTLASKVSFK
jgi:phospholipid/cholesterol/gamma-HCH transport system substrate-binding protein